MRTKNQNTMWCTICNWTIIQDLGPIPRRGTSNKFQESQSRLTTQMMSLLLQCSNDLLLCILWYNIVMIFFPIQSNDDSKHIIFRNVFSNEIQFIFFHYRFSHKGTKLKRNSVLPTTAAKLTFLFNIPQCGIFCIFSIIQI